MQYNGDSELWWSVSYVHFQGITLILFRVDWMKAYTVLHTKATGRAVCFQQGFYGWLQNSTKQSASLRTEENVLLFILSSSFKHE